MQAVVLAAGKSSRFVPFNDLSHKSCMVIMGKPLVVHTVLSLQRSGISHVILIIGKGSLIPSLIAKETAITIPIDYVIQEESLGMGDALLKAEQYIQETFFLLHGHHVDFPLFFKDMVDKKKKCDAVLLAKKSDIIHRYGALKIKEDTVVDLVEKPKIGTEPSKLRVIGIYLLTKEFVQTLKETPPDHYHFEHALSVYVKKHAVKAVVTDKDTITFKYAWDVLEAKNFLLKNVQKHISKKANIAKSAEIIGDVYIDDGAQIMEKASVKGPCYIGKNVTIGNNAIIRNGSDIEEHVTVGANMEVKNSLILSYSTTHSGFIGDSVIGGSCKIAAHFTTGNVRLDRGPVTVKINGEEIETGLSSLGAIIGSKTNIGIHVSTMPGVIIGNNVVVGPSTSVMKSIADDVVYYTKFQEVVEKKNIGNSDKDKKKKIILFDIDNTIFDSRSFRKVVYKKMQAILKKHGKNHSIEEFDMYTDTFIRENGLFDPEDFVEEFAKDIHEDSKHIIRDLFYDKEGMKEFLYKEVVEELAKFAELGEVGILSQGIAEFQLAKFASISSLFHPKRIHIARNKREAMTDLFQKYNAYKLFFIDDLRKMLAHAKEAHPDITTLWIRRGNNFHDNSEYKPDVEIDNLSQAYTFIKNS